MIDIEGEIEQILRQRNPHALLRPDLPLGTAGLGLDSIAMVEVLLAVEEKFGVVLAAEMLASENVTVGELAGRVRTLVAL